MGAQPDTSTSAPEVWHGVLQILAPIFVPRLLATYLVRRRLICKGKLPFSLNGGACPSRSTYRRITMHTESAFGAQGGCCAGPPTGLRRLTLSLLQATHAAEGFAGLPPDVSRPAQVLAAFKAAAPCLGLPPRLG